MAQEHTKIFLQGYKKMAIYSSFAMFYDQLTENINYDDRAAYFNSITKKHGNGGNLLLDLACGTGSLSIKMEDLGFDVIGTDVSVDMLNMAMEKKHNNIIFLCQPMDKLDMYGTMDVVICALDSINHEPNIKKVQRAFERVSLFLNDGGLFIFDVNSEYKHEIVLGDNTFIYDLENIYCVWQNNYNKNQKQTTINLDFFCTDDEFSYTRYEESFVERVYTHDQILEFIENSGLEFVDMYEGDTFLAPTENSERIVYVTRKNMK